jgi:hypothetical protein
VLDQVKELEHQTDVPTSCFAVLSGWASVCGW